MRGLMRNLNIIYICTADKGPAGGPKVIYNHSDIINKINKNVTSEVLHIKKKKYRKWNTSIKKFLNIKNSQYFGWKLNDITVEKNFKSKWLNSNIKIKNTLNFNKNKDFVIFPEIFAHLAADLLRGTGVHYAIFVQNGYLLNITNDYKKLNEGYKNAKFILSYSKDITNCINLGFKNCKNKILKTNTSVDIKKFNFKIKKNNIITYMPRKLSHHSENLVFFLKNKLPKGWKLKSLSNLTEEKIYQELSRSKIFLSFSNMEGLGIPPIEAAIAGNHVIGYPGEGGKDYWKKPIFTEIPHGNLSKFSSEILAFIKKKKFKKIYFSARKKIINQYSSNQERIKVQNMLSQILKF